MKMIKRNILALIFLLAMGSLAAGQVYDHCDVKELKDTCKNYLNIPYRYDASNIILIQYKNKEQVKEVELPLFVGEHYKLIFNTYALPPGVQIDVYDKDQFHDSRKTMFSCSSSDTKKIYIYEPEHHSKLYIDYIIPRNPNKSSDGTPDVAGCGIVLVGYR